MSVSWGVIPIVPEIHAWLEENGFVVEVQQTRYPTLDEFIVVLETFNLPIVKDPLGDNLVGIAIGDIYTENYANILGNIGEEGFNFHFWGSGCQEQTMIEILKGLSKKCGPLVIYESIAATPLVVDEKTDTERAIIEWNDRIQEKYDASGQ